MEIRTYILLRVWGSVFWGSGLNLLTPSFTISLSYSQLRQLTINDRLRLTPFWLDYECLVSSLSSTVTDLVLIYESVTSSASVVRWLTLHSWTLNSTQLLNFWTLLRLNHKSFTTESIYYMSSLHNFRMNWIEINNFNSSRYCVLICCCGNMSSDLLSSNGCPSTVDSITLGTCLPNCCLAMSCASQYVYALSK
jgi:hypothetical protein